MNNILNSSFNKTVDVNEKIIFKPGEFFSRFTKGTLANLLSNVINIFGHIILVPVFFAFWGKQLYGEWLILYAVVGYLIFIDFGITAYVINRLNQCYSRNDLKEYSRILHSSLFLTIIISSIAFFLALILISNFPLARWFIFIQMKNSTAILVSVIFLIQVIVSLPKGIILGLYRTMGEYYRGQALTALTQFFLITLTILSLNLGSNPVQVAGIQLIPLFGSFIYVYWDLQKRHPNIHLGIKNKDYKLAFSFLKPSAFFFLITLSTLLIIQGGAILVGAGLGAGVVAIFVTHRTLANLIRQLAQTFIFSLWPELTTLEAQGHVVILRKIYIFATKALLLLGICASLGIHFVGNDIVAIWTQDPTIYNQELMDPLLLLSVTQIPWLVGATFLGSTNNHRLLSIFQFTSAVFGLLCAYFLIQKSGLPGVAWGLWFSDFFICTLLIPWKTCRLIHQNYYNYLVQVYFRGLLFTLLIYITGYGLNQFFTVFSPAARIMIFACYISLIGFLFGYWVIFGRSERETIHEWSSKLFEYLTKPKAT